MPDFASRARSDAARSSGLIPVRAQELQLRRLVKKARATRFGRDHRFEAIDSVSAFQRAVPIRTYEALWDDYLRASYPVFDNLTWPGRIPYIALSSGTTQGPTKFIPVSWEMVRSNRRAAQHHARLAPGSPAGLEAL